LHAAPLAQASPDRLGLDLNPTLAVGSRETRSLSASWFGFVDWSFDKSTETHDLILLR
jgi:hypothetical protein